MIDLPTAAVSCSPFYLESYFIFDREDLQSLSSAGSSSELTSVHNRDGATVYLYASETRTIIDIVFWSCFVAVLSFLLLSVPFCCYCCLCYINRRSATQRKNVKMPFLLVFGSGIITAALVLLSFVDSSILMWLEIDLNQNLTRQVDSVQSYINMTTQLVTRDNDTVKQITIDPLFRLQDIRFWISLGVLGCLLVILAITFLSVCVCTPLSRSTAPMVTMLAVGSACTIFTSLLAAGLFGTLLFLSVICYDLYQLGGDRWCDRTSNVPYERTLGKLCGRDTINQFYITAGVYGILIILLVLVQLLGGVYTALVSRGYRERHQTRRTTRQPTQARQRPQEERRRPSQHQQNQQRRSSRNTGRRTSNRVGGTDTREETFILRTRPSSQHQRDRHRNASARTRHMELGHDVESQNLSGFNLSTDTYPEAPPSYDEVIRRDSETSSTAPLILSPQGMPVVTPLNRLTEDEELSEDTEVDSGQATVQGISSNSNQETAARGENVDH